MGSIQKDKLIYTNIQKYQVDDADCENLCMKAVLCGIGEIVVGPSSLPTVKKLAQGRDICMGASIAYPSGAYFPDAKAEEIAEIVTLHPEVRTFYVVMAVGRFLSGYEAETAEEMKLTKQAAQERKVFFMTEAAVLSEEQLKRVCDIAAENGIDGIVDTTGFEPYDVPFPTVEDTKRLVLAAAGRLPVYANGRIKTEQDAAERISAGAQAVIMIGVDALL